MEVDLISADCRDAAVGVDRRAVELRRVAVCGVDNRSMRVARRVPDECWQEFMDLPRSLVQLPLCSFLRPDGDNRIRGRSQIRSLAPHPGVEHCHTRSQVRGHRVGGLGILGATADRHVPDRRAGERLRPGVASARRIRGGWAVCRRRIRGPAAECARPNRATTTGGRDSHGIRFAAGNVGALEQYCSPSCRNATSAPHLFDREWTRHARPARRVRPFHASTSSRSLRDSASVDPSRPPASRRNRCGGRQYRDPARCPRPVVSQLG